MSKIDVQAPSEAEDFDTVNNTISSDASTAPEVETPQTVETNAPEPAETPRPETQSEPEDAADEPATEVEPIEEPAPAADDPVPKSGQGRVRRPFGRLLFEGILVVALVVLSLWSWNVYADRKNLQDQLSKVNANPQALVEKQTNDLLSRVGALMQLPTGETPTIAAVSDAAQARQQSAFFANAQNGDKVLMYVKAGEAILYRPSTNKIILVAPLTFNNSAAAAKQ